MTGRLLEVLVSDGDDVNRGDLLVVIESMKMENEVLSQHQGRVVAVHAREMQTVSEGDAMLEIETGQ